MRMVPFPLVAITVLNACATGGAVPESGESEAAQLIEVIVDNRSQSIVTAYAQWESGSRVRLGRVDPSSVVTFSTSVRERAVGLSFSHQGLNTTRPDETPAELIAVAPGDRIRWTIRSLDPDVDIVYARVPPS